MTGRLPTLLALGALAALPAAATPPAGFSENPVATGLDRPTDIAFSPLDGAIWICEQDGTLWIKRTGQPLKLVIQIPISSGCERGLLGIAFDPSFATNHYVYLYYTHNAAQDRNRVSRFTEASDVLSNETPIIDDLFVSSACNHNGGVLQFSPTDGKLYVGVGDNANSGNSQDLTTPLGKVLRVNNDGTPAAGNPFSAPNDPRIWNYGLRNPWRLDFDDANGDLYIADVGQNTWEEIDFSDAGGRNFRWPMCEGTCGSGTGFENPIHQYPNGGSGAVTGGPVYRGSNFPASYQGAIFYGDSSQGFIRYLKVDANHQVTSDNAFEPLASGPVDIEIGPDGCLYYAAIWSGEVVQICNSNPPPVASFSGAPLSGPAPLTVNFTNTSTNATSYAWTFGDGGTSTAANPAHTYVATGSYTVALTATGPNGSDTETKPNYVTVTALVPANVVTGLGPDAAAAPRVQAWSSTGQPNATLDFAAYGTGGYGVNVGRGDVNGAGTDEILTGPGPSPSFGPQVRAFLTPTATSVGKVNFYAYATLKYGVHAEGGNVDGDAPLEIVTTPGPGAVFGPHVRGWNFDNTALAAISKITFFAFSTLKFGARNHGGSIDGDAFDEIVVGPGPGGVFGSLVRAFNYDATTITSISKVNFQAYSGLFYGVQVSVADADGDGIGEILTGPGEGPANPSQGRGWNYDGVTLAPLAGLDFEAYTGATHGVLIAGGDVDGDGKEEILTMPASPALAPRGRGWNYEASTITAIAALDFVCDPNVRYGGNIDGGNFGF